MANPAGTEYFLELDHVLGLFNFIHSKYPGILYSRDYSENPFTLYQRAHQLSQKLGVVPYSGPYNKHRFSFSTGMIETEIFQKAEIELHLKSCFELILQLKKDFKPKGLEADLIQLLDIPSSHNIQERYNLVKAFFQIIPLLYDREGNPKPVNWENTLSAVLTDHAAFDNQYMDLLFAHLSQKIHKILQEKNVLKTPDRVGINFEAMQGSIQKTFKKYRTIEITHDKSAKHTKHKRELIEVPWWLSFFGGNLRSVEDCSIRSSVFCGLIPESKMFFYQDPDTKKVLGYVYVVAVKHPEYVEPIPYILTPNGRHFKAADIKGIGQAVQSIYKTDCCILIDAADESYEYFVNFTGCREGIKRLVKSGQPIQDLILPNGWNDELIVEHPYFYYHQHLIQEGILVKLDPIPVTSTKIDYSLPETDPKSLPELTRHYFAALCLINQGDEEDFDEVPEEEPNEFSIDKNALFQMLNVTAPKVEIMQIGLEHSTFALTAKQALSIKRAFGKEGLLLSLQQMDPLENLQTLYRLRSHLKFWITQEKTQALSKKEIIALIEKCHQELMTLEEDQDEYTSNEISAAYDELQSLCQISQLNAYFLPEMVNLWSPKLPDSQKRHVLKMFNLLLCFSNEIGNRPIFLEHVLPCLKQAVIDDTPLVREEALRVALHYVPLEILRPQDQNQWLMLLVDSFTVDGWYSDRQASFTTLKEICPKILGTDISQQLYGLLKHQDEIVRKGVLEILLSTQIEIDLDQETQAVETLGQVELKYFSAYAQTMFYGHGTPTHTSLLFAMTFEDKFFLQQAAEKAFLKMKTEQPAIFAKHLCALSMGDPVLDPTHRIATKAIEIMEREHLSVDSEDCLFLINTLQKFQITTETQKNLISLFKILPEKNKKELATILAESCLKKQSCFSSVELEAFLALGPAAEVAIPLFVSIVYSHGSPPQHVREAVHTVLDQMDSTGQKSIIPLLQILRNSKIYRVLEKLKTITPSPTQVPELIAELESSVPDVIAATAQLLDKIGPAAHAAVPTLLKCMEENADCHLKYTVAIATIHIAPESKEVTHQILSQTNEDARDSLLSVQYRESPSTVIQTLEDLFKDKTQNNAMRVYALNRLVHLAPEAIETKEAVLCALSDPSEDVQKVTNYLLKKVTLDQAAIPLLTIALENKNLWLGSVIAFGYLGEAAKNLQPDAIRAAKNYMDDLTEDASYALLKALAAMNSSYSELIPFAVATIPKHACSAIRFLEEQGSIPESAVLPIAEVLTKKLEEKYGKNDAVFLIETLQKLGSTAYSAVPVLFSALGHSYHKVTQAAQLALKVIIPIQQLPELLCEKSKDPNPQVRYKVLQLLVECDPLSPKTVQTLLGAVQDNAVSVRGFATKTLSTLTLSEENIPALENALLQLPPMDHSNAKKHIALIAAIFKIGPHDPIVLLERLISSSDPERTKPIILYFKKDPTAGIHLLTTILSSHNPKLHMLGAEAVIQLGQDAKAVAPALEAALLRHTVDSCVPILQALSKIDVPIQNIALIPLLVEGLQTSGSFSGELHKLAAQTLEKAEFDLQPIAMDLVHCLSMHYVIELSPLIRKIHPTPEMLPRLIQTMAENLYSCYCLEDCIHLLSRMGDAAKPALSMLVQVLCSLPDHEQDTKRNISTMISALAPNPEDQVSLYVEVLQDRYEDVRLRAAQALSQLGEAAKGAIPQLVAAFSFSEISQIIDIVLPDVEERVGHMVNLLIHADKKYQNVLFKLSEMIEIETAQPILLRALKTIPSSVLEKSLKISPKETLNLIQLLGREGVPFVPQIIQGLIGESWWKETKIVALKTLKAIRPEINSVSSTIIDLLRDRELRTPALELLAKLELDPDCSLELLRNGVPFLVTKMVENNPNGIGLAFAKLLRENIGACPDARSQIFLYLKTTQNIPESIFIQVLPELSEQNIAQLTPAFLKTKPKEPASIPILCKALTNPCMDSKYIGHIIHTLENMDSPHGDMLFLYHEAANNHTSLKPQVHSLLLKALGNDNNSVCLQQAIIRKLPDYVCKLNDTETITTIRCLSAIISNRSENNPVKEDAQAVLRKIIVESNDAVERLPDFAGLLSWNETQNNNHPTVRGCISEAISTIVQRDTLDILEWFILKDFHTAQDKHFIKIITASEPTSETIMGALLNNNRVRNLTCIQMAFDFMRNMQRPFSVHEALQIIQIYVNFSEKQMNMPEPILSQSSSFELHC